VCDIYKHTHTYICIHYVFFIKHDLCCVCAEDGYICKLKHVGLTCIWYKLCSKFLLNRICILLIGQMMCKIKFKSLNFCYISREVELQQMFKLNCLLCIVVIHLNTNNSVMLIKRSISLCLLFCLSCVISFSNCTTYKSYILMWHVGSLFYLTSVASYFLFACFTYTSSSFTSLFPSAYCRICQFMMSHKQSVWTHARLQGDLYLGLHYYGMWHFVTG